MNKYIAIDIGASSGRLMLSEKDKLGKISLEEIHRFKNGLKKNNETYSWDSQHLIHEILVGLEKIKKRGITTCFVGIDTWGVDYCLINQDGEALSQPVSYRDNRTKNVFEEFENVYPLKELYYKTGIQLQHFNTIFQLFKEPVSKLQKADKLLLIPDYLGFLLTGNVAMEKTNASTTQLFNLRTRKLDKEILNIIGIEETLFPKLVEPGSILGNLKQENFPEYDLPNAIIITIASHDTASAVVGTPGKGDNWAYISSGTWSLMGVEIPEGISTREVYEANLTNEWGVQGTIRFLKNIMGMWLIQEVARIQNYQYSYPELAKLAVKEEPFKYLININDNRFLNPENMIEAIQTYCGEHGQEVPLTAGQLARCIYDSLAICYSKELEELEKITNKKIDVLHIVGGGSNNDFLNQLTANTCGIKVIAGPGEATAIGNIVVQMIATQGFGTLAKAREGIKRSFQLNEYQPISSEGIKLAKEKYQNLIKN